MAHPVPIEPHTVDGGMARRPGHGLLVARRSRSTRAPRPPRSSRSPSIASASSSATWAAASAASATSTSRRTSPRSPGPPGGRSGWSSAGSEEFVAPDKVTHAMVVDLETGIDRGRARSSPGTARILLDCGAYAARHAGPRPDRRDDGRRVRTGSPTSTSRRSRVYTNRTPSGSVRAPTGPAGLLGGRAAPRRARRAGRPRSGRVPPAEPRPTTATRARPASGTRATARIDTLETAARRIGWPASRSGPNEAIGVASGWWFSAPGPSGAFVRLESDGSGRIVTGAQENGTGAVMALPILAAEVLGMQPEDFAITYQDTDAGPYDGGSSGSQTTFNNGRAVVEAAQRGPATAPRARRRGARGGGRRPGAGRRRMRGVVGQPGSAGLDRGAGVDGPRRVPCCSAVARAMPPDGPEHDASACVGRLGFESFAAPTFFCHAARVRVDPPTGVVRALKVVAATDVGRVLNPIGAPGPGDRRRRDGAGQRDARGHASTAATGGSATPSLLDYKLLTTADAPEIEASSSSTRRRTAGRGLEGRRGAADRPDRGRGRERDRRGDRRPRPAPADDAGAGLAGRARPATTAPPERNAPFGPAVASVPPRRAPMSVRAFAVAGVARGRARDRSRPTRTRGRSPAGRIWSSPPRQGRQAAAASRSSRSTGSPSSAGSAVDDGRLDAGRADVARVARRRRRTFDSAGRRWPTRRRSSARRRRAATGTLGGNLMNASPAAETTAPLVVFGASVDAARRRAARRGRSRSRSWRPGPAGRSRRRASC